MNRLAAWLFLWSSPSTSLELLHCNHLPWQYPIQRSLPEAQKSTDAHQRHLAAPASESTLEHAERLSLSLLCSQTCWPNDVQASTRNCGYRPDVNNKIQVRRPSPESSDPASARQDEDLESALDEIIPGFENATTSFQRPMDNTHSITSPTDGRRIIPCLQICSKSARMMCEELAVCAGELRSGQSPMSLPSKLKRRGILLHLI